MSTERPVERPVGPLVDRLENAAHAWENNLTICGDYMPSPSMLREAAAAIRRLSRDKEALKEFKSPASAGAIGLTDAQMRHLRWAIAKGLCTAPQAADRLGIDRASMLSLLKA